MPSAVLPDALTRSGRWWWLAWCVSRPRFFLFHGVRFCPLVLIGGRLAWALRLLREPCHCCYCSGLWALIADFSSFYVSSAEGHRVRLRNVIP